MGWEIIIGPILNMLMAKCFERLNAPQSPQEYVRSRWNERRGRFDEGLVRETSKATRKALAQARRKATRQERKLLTKVTPSEIREATISKLHEVMVSSEREVAGVLLLARSFEEEGDV